MGIFGSLISSFRSSFGTVVLYAPTDGELMDITEVPDETFSQKILGDGIAIRPTSGRICAPCDGVLETIMESRHAFSMTADDGTELLIHVGVDTVELKGRHFTSRNSEKNMVKKGDLVLEADLDAIRADGYDPVTIIIVLNGDRFSGMDKAAGNVRQGDEVLRLKK